MNGSELIATLLRGAVALGIMLLAAGISARICGNRTSWWVAAGVLLLVFLALLVGVVSDPREAGLLYSLEWGVFGAGLYAAGRALRGNPQASDDPADPERLLQFWFGDEPFTAEHVGARSALWFGVDARFDRAIREGFGDWPERALAGEFRAWPDSPRSALAGVITLDQIPRNLHRGDRRAFAFDGHALELALRSIERGFDRELHPVEAVFLYLPLEHAEDVAMQNRCVDLFARLRDRSPGPLRENFASFCDYAERHRAVIERFGRFPHRNEILDRAPSAEEAAWLRDGGDRFGG